MHPFCFVGQLVLFLEEGQSHTLSCFQITRRTRLCIKEELLKILAALHRQRDTCVLCCGRSDNSGRHMVRNFTIATSAVCSSLSAMRTHPGILGSSMPSLPTDDGPTVYPCHALRHGDARFRHRSNFTSACPLNGYFQYWRVHLANATQSRLQACMDGSSCRV